MSATRAPSAAPINAVMCWTDDRSVYVEVPGPQGGAIFAFPLHEGGLAKALNLLRAQRYDFGGKPLITPPKTAPTARQALAESILRRRGMVK